MSTKKPDGRSEKTDTPPVSPRATVQAQPEIQEYLEVSHEQHALFPRAALVGLCAGIVAVVFRGLVESGEGMLAFIKAFIFVGILFLGLIYSWVKGDLEWVKKIKA